ncbi:MAG: hypothetical protein U5R31_08645 [Acidimicrobiia bacterium]|nr:hypothetical protein [Acidimicrobiia bacterium]
MLIFLGIPLLAGFLTRPDRRASQGRRVVRERLPAPHRSRSPSTGLLFTIVVLFSPPGRGRSPTSRLDVARIALPLLVYFAIMWRRRRFAIGLKMGLPYDRNTTVAFTAAGNNFELAIAVAIGVFGVTSGRGPRRRGRARSSRCPCSSAWSTWPSGPAAASTRPETPARELRAVGRRPHPPWDAPTTSTVGRRLRSARL